MRARGGLAASRGLRDNVNWRPRRACLTRLVRRHPAARLWTPPLRSFSCTAGTGSRLAPPSPDTEGWRHDQQEESSGQRQATRPQPIRDERPAGRSEIAIRRSARKRNAGRRRGTTRRGRPNRCLPYVRGHPTRSPSGDPNPGELGTGRTRSRGLRRFRRIRARHARRPTARRTDSRARRRADNRHPWRRSPTQRPARFTRARRTEHDGRRIRGPAR